MDESDLKRRVSSIGGSASDLSGVDLPETDGTSSSGGKGLAIAALGLGLFGIIAGVAGIVMANQASTQIAVLRKQLANRDDPMVAVQPKLDEFDNRVAQNSAEAMRANRAVSDINSRLQQFAKLIAADRAQINRNTASLAGATPPPPPPATTQTGTAEKTVTTTAAAGTQIHVIESGDTFSSLAHKYGVSLKDIQEANPTADSTRLQIGQKIVIPTDKK